MTSLYAELLALDPTRRKLTKKFYLDMLKARDVAIRGLTPAMLLDESRAVENAIDKLEELYDKAFDRQATKMLDMWPTNLQVLMAIGECHISPVMSCVCAHAVRQLAAIPTVAARKQCADNSDLVLDMIGLDLLFGTLSDLHLYDAMQTHFHRETERAPHAMQWLCMRVMSALVNHDSDDATMLFSYAAGMAAIFDDTFSQVELQLICLAHHFYVDGADATFSSMLTKFNALDCDPNDDILVEIIDDLNLRVPGFVVAMGYRNATHGGQTPAPGLGKPPSAPSMRTSSALPMPIGNPMKDLHRLMDRQKFESVEDAQAFMNQFMGKPIPEVPLHDLTPDELVEDLLEEAKKLDKEEQRTVLMGIANDYPDSMWPWLGLVDVSKSPHEVLTFAEGGLLRGKRFEDPEYLRENTGHFWGLTETRPYMRLLFHKAMGLHATGRTEEALAVFERILLLNPYDNMGVRDEFVCLLLRRGLRHHIARAEALFEQFADDAGQPLHDWMLLLLNIITKRPTDVIQASFDAAMKSCGIIGHLICGTRPPGFTGYVEKPTDAETYHIMDFFNFGKSTWETYPDAVKKVRQLVGRLG